MGKDSSHGNIVRNQTTKLDQRKRGNEETPFVRSCDELNHQLTQEENVTHVVNDE